MNKPITKIEAAPQVEALTGLDLLRKPFEKHQISKLPKPTKKQTDEVRANFKAGIRCGLCGQWHHKDVVHLDYVGHAALTDRLLECDPEWNWEPVAFSPEGIPLTDQSGGMWIRLTVCGVTRLGYGDADGKQGGNAVKERIGDALRNAAMRFGAALDLWHKGELHPEEPEAVEPIEDHRPATVTPEQFVNLRDTAHKAGVEEAKVCSAYKAPSFQQFPQEAFERAMKRLNATIAENAESPDNSDLNGDYVPH